MNAHRNAEQQFLQRLIGAWTLEASVISAPGQPAETQTATEHVRDLGGGWVIAEGSFTLPDGNVSSIMSLGYDPARARVVGSFVSSMMTHLWVYEGTLDAAGRSVTLFTEGPSFTTEGQIGKYKDVIAFESDDHRVLASNYLGEDGEWHRLMTAHYRRMT